MFSLANVSANSGGSTALSGILVVFSGLMLIALVIYLFNLVFRERPAPSIEADGEVPPIDGPDAGAGKHEPAAAMEEIPADDLAAIAALIELYRRVHFDRLQSQITFVRGQDAASAWQLGYKYGQRQRF